MLVTKAFGMDPTGIEFLDVDLNTDTLFFIDPIMIKCWDNTAMGKESLMTIDSFRIEAVKALRSGDDVLINRLFNDHLHECNAVRLGYSSGNPHGRGMGEKNTGDFLANLKNNEAFLSGAIEEIEDLVFEVPGLGEDRLSDILVNVIKYPLLKFTEEQVRKYKMPSFKKEFEYWDYVTKTWKKGVFSVPGWTNGPIILVPNYYCTDYLYISQDQLYNKGFIKDLSVDAALKGRKVTLKQLKVENPYFYTKLIKHIIKDYDSLRKYKEWVKSKLKNYNSFFGKYPKVDGYTLPEADRIMRKARKKKI